MDDVVGLVVLAMGEGAELVVVVVACSPVRSCCRRGVVSGCWLPPRVVVVSRRTEAMARSRVVKRGVVVDICWGERPTDLLRGVVPDPAVPDRRSSPLL